MLGGVDLSKRFNKGESEAKNRYASARSLKTPLFSFFRKRGPSQVEPHRNRPVCARASVALARNSFCCFVLNQCFVSYTIIHYTK